MTPNEMLLSNLVTFIKSWAEHVQNRILPMGSNAKSNGCTSSDSETTMEVRVPVTSALLKACDFPST